MDGRIANCIRLNEARRLDITGLRCNALTVLGPSDRRRGAARLWRCICDCGNEAFQVSWFLRAGRIKSCGCLTKSLIRRARTTHGDTDTPTWRSWRSMHMRCYSVSHKSYADYGGRGITVCDRWHSYEAFKADMGDRPALKTIGRLDNDGNYEPNNCEWQTATEQSRNRRSSALLEYQGRVRCASEWAEELGLTVGAICKRLKAGWSIERTLTTPGKRQVNSRCRFVEMA